MDFAEQNPRAGTLARPYDYFIDTLRPYGRSQTVEKAFSSFLRRIYVFSGAGASIR